MVNTETKKISQREFESMPIMDKIDLVQDTLLNSIYECITCNKAKLPDLVKAQTIFNRSIQLRTKERDKNTNKFVSTSSKES